MGPDKENGERQLPEEPPRGEMDRLRLELLGELVPPVVHELNNFMAVLRGVLDILLHDKQDPSGRQAIDVSVAASDLLVRLASYAKGDEGRHGPLDPASALWDLEPLLKAYTKSKGIRFELVAARGFASIQGDPRSVWRCLGTLAMLFARDAHVRDLTARMSIRMGFAEGSVRLRFTATSAGPIDGAQLEVALAELARAVERVDSVVEHRFGRAWALEVRLPAVVQERHRSAGSARSRARVLLLGVGEDFEDELEELLRESGYVVLRPARETNPVGLLLSTAADVALVSARVLSESSELMLRFVEGRIPGKLGIVLLGAEGPIGDICSLPSPCPPDDLLAAIEGQL